MQRRCICKDKLVGWVDGLHVLFVIFVQIDHSIMIFMIYSDHMNYEYLLYYESLSHSSNAFYPMEYYVIYLFSMNQNSSKRVYR